MIVDIDSGNSQLVTNRFGDKFLFYFDGKNIYQVCKQGDTFCVVKGTLDSPQENVIFDVDYFDSEPYSIDLLDESCKEDILGFLLEEVL